MNAGSRWSSATRCTNDLSIFSWWIRSSGSRAAGLDRNAVLPVTSGVRLEVARFDTGCGGVHTPQTHRRRRTGMAILGIDIGGSGVKGAPVDTERGVLLQERFRVPTPQPSDVSSVVQAVAEVAAQFDGYDRVGATFPGVVVDGVTRTAANVDKSWLDAPAASLFAERLGMPVSLLND